MQDHARTGETLKLGLCNMTHTGVLWSRKDHRAEFELTNVLDSPK